MIETKRLQPEEYSGLAAVAEGHVPSPDASIAVVATDEGRVVGRMFVVFVAHLEGTWVESESRGGAVVRRLFDRIQGEAKSAGLGRVMAYSTSGEHDAYLHRLGFERMPWTVWGKDL